MSPLPAQQWHVAIQASCDSMLPLQKADFYYRGHSFSQDQNPAAKVVFAPLSHVSRQGRHFHYASFKPSRYALDDSLEHDAQGSGSYDFKA